MASPKYLDAVRGILDHYEQTQLAAIDQAAELIVAAITHDGAVFCAEIGHSNQNDFLNRAGGLAAVQGFSFNFHINDPVADCLKERPQPEGVRARPGDHPLRRARQQPARGRRAAARFRLREKPPSHRAGAGLPRERRQSRRLHFAGLHRQCAVAASLREETLRCLRCGDRQRRAFRRRGHRGARHRWRKSARSPAPAWWSAAGSSGSG